MVDDDGQVFVFENLVEKIAKFRLRPNQVDPHGQFAAGEDGPANLRLWSFVGTYGVKNDVCEHRGSGYHWLALPDYLAASLTSRTARPL
jgi:hypothetical protein